MSVQNLRTTLIVVGIFQSGPTGQMDPRCHLGMAEKKKKHKSLTLMLDQLVYNLSSYGRICHQCSWSGRVLVVSGDVDLSLHAPPARCAVSACLSGGENSKLNINVSGAVTFPLQLHHRPVLKEAGKNKTTKGYHLPCLWMLGHCNAGKGVQ